MSKTWRNHLTQAIVFTLIACNLMLFALIMGQKKYPIAETVTSVPEMSRPQFSSEYTMEFISAKEYPSNQNSRGKWRVEHYREYEYRFDAEGKLLDRRPTSKEENIRYWVEN